MALCHRPQFELYLKGQSVDVKQGGRELGVRYVLEGSVRKAGGRVRITGQLIDASSDSHLWADHFDGSLEDVFDVQDRVAVSVAGVIEPTLQAAEMRRSAARPTTDLSAYDLYLRGSTGKVEHLGDVGPSSRGTEGSKIAANGDVRLRPVFADAADEAA